MRNTVQRHAIILAALLQVLPLIRNFFANPAAANAFAFILRWGVGSAAVVGAYDAHSAATNFFAGPTNFTVTINTPFTNNFLLTKATSGDGGALCTVSSTTSTNVLSNGQTITNSMPTGLTFKFIDVNTGSSGFSNVYCRIFGIPTAIGTNSFHAYLFYQAGTAPVDGDIKIAVTSGGNSIPAITNNPIAGATNLVGTTNNLFSVVAGTAPLSYQWYFNTNTAVTSATNATLTLTNIQLTNAGWYRCTITNSAGATNSANALLTVWQPPVITNNPVGVTNVAGGSANFSVVAGGVPSVTYQWRLNPSTTQSGATASTFNLTNLRASQTGTYSVVVTNSAGAITSPPVTLLVTNPLPPSVSTSIVSGNQFQFTFNGIPGLTNTVLTNDNLSGGVWNIFTNIPPPANNNPITIGSPAGRPILFYRLMVTP